MKFPRLKDPASALTHLVGAVLSVIGLFVLLYQGAVYGNTRYVVAFAIFGTSLILLYTASTLYHALHLSPQATLRLRKVDHMMIFLLIAGTYTPFCLLPLRGVWGWSLLGAVWGCAVVGMGVKLFWMTAPRWLSTGFYVLMGWAVVVAIYPLARSVSAGSLAWMVTGGLIYTVGAVLYATKWPRLWPGKFGFHDLWHLFVMGGSLAHFAAILLLLK
jgi:hemolysin III